MSITEIKNNFHNLIDNIHDAEILENFYEGLVLSSVNGLLKELSEEGKEEILLVYEESENENNLIVDEVGNEKIKKWLQK